MKHNLDERTEPVLLRRWKRFLGVVIGLALLGTLLYKPLVAYWNDTGEFRRAGPDRTKSPTVAFSPDNKHFAYLWRDSLYQSPEGRGMSTRLTDTVEIRWASTAHPEKELAAYLASADLRTQKTGYFGRLGIDADFSFSPDSTKLAAVWSRSLLIIDLATRQFQRFAYPNERFSGFRWLSAQEMAFATSNEKGAFVWRLKVGANTQRRLVCQYDESGIEVDWEPLTLFRLHWSPNGHYAVDVNKLIHVLTGKVRTLPAALTTIYWRPDSTVFLGKQWIEDAQPPASDTNILLIDAATGAVEDFTSRLGKYCGNYTPCEWTADGRFFIGNTEASFDAAGNLVSTEHGYLFQLKPFQVKLKTKGTSRAAPLPGWFLFNNAGLMKYSNYDGTRTAPLHGWEENWSWSEDGKYAAEITSEGKVKVFQPTPPQ
jgi:hypothetical protein